MLKTNNGWQNPAKNNGLYCVWIRTNERPDAPTVCVWIDPTMTTLEMRMRPEEQPILAGNDEPPDPAQNRVDLVSVMA